MVIPEIKINLERDLVSITRKRLIEIGTPLGGGVSAARTSLVDGMRTDHLRRWANERQKRVLQEMPEIIRRAASDPRGRGFGNIIDLRLVYLRNNNWILCDENSAYTHPLPSP